MVVGTTTADHGEKSPSAAPAAFVLTFEDGSDALGVERLIVQQRRNQISRQRRDYIATMEVGPHGHGLGGHV
jgi:hypothetical protein